MTALCEALQLSVLVAAVCLVTATAYRTRDAGRVTFRFIPQLAVWSRGPSRARHTAPQSCAPDQKRLALAIEMYNDDHKCNFAWHVVRGVPLRQTGAECLVACGCPHDPPLRGDYAVRIPLAFSRALVEGGYLQAMPFDPGRRAPQSAEDFCVWNQGNGVSCTVHGALPAVGPRKSQFIDVYPEHLLIMMLAPLMGLRWGRRKDDGPTSGGRCGFRRR